jgi:uncharacterized metal-binding protein
MAECCCGSNDKTYLAAMGAGLSGFVESAKAAGENLVIDGCPVACGKKIFENLGIPFRQFVVTDYGVEKGTTEITPELIGKTAFSLAEELAGERDRAGV